jgi:hypothetical protein
MRQVGWLATAESVTVRYAHADLEVEVVYELRPGDHFLQKRLTVTFAAGAEAPRITLSRPLFTAAGLELACYRHPDFDWVTEYVEAKHGCGLHGVTHPRSPATRVDGFRLRLVLPDGARGVRHR